MTSPPNLAVSLHSEASEHLEEIARTGARNFKRNELAFLKQHLLEDPFDFARIVCRHVDLTDDYHRPLAYIAGQCVKKLVDLLNTDRRSYVTHALRTELVRRGIDWNDPVGRALLERLLEFVNLRLYRGSAKSSVCTHATCLWYATRDPNETIAIISGNDDGAEAFCRQIRDTMESELYRLFFPERIPEGDLTKLWTQSQIWFGGRTNPAKEWTITAKGYTSNWTRLHFTRFFIDDIVGENTCSPPHLKAAKIFLAGLRGLFVPQLEGKRVSRHHIGTIYDEDDDHKFLSSIARCLTILVPIEVYDGEVEDVTVRGTPTNPDWHDVDAIREIQEDVCGDPEQGPLSYKRNFWLNPYAGGGRMFPPSLVDNANWRKVKLHNVAVMQRDKRDEKGARVPARGGKGYAQVHADPNDLYRVLGIDPAFSEKGDDWAISAVAGDYESHGYQLETRRGKGFEALKFEILRMERRWQPRVIGIERAASQEQSFKTLFEYDPEFRRIRSLFVPVEHKNLSKEWRIANMVAEPMRMGRLHLNPADIETKIEMKAYIPGRKAVDNILDSLAIAQVLLRKGPSGKGEDLHTRLARRKARINAKRDPITGVKWVA